MLSFEEQAKTLSVEEAARRWGIEVVSARQYAARGRVPGVYDGDRLVGFKEKDVETYRRNRGTPVPRGKGGEPALQQTSQFSLIVPVPEQKPLPDEETLLQLVLTSVFTFLRENNLPIGLQSMREIGDDEQTVRLWEVKTPATPVRILAEDQDLTVLSDAYQKRLEQRVRDLEEQVRHQDVTIRLLRKKAQEWIVTDYSHPFAAWMEGREDGWIIWCEDFPFAARGEDEEDAKKNFRFMLWGYICWLRRHEKELTQKQQNDLAALKDLMDGSKVEEKIP